MVSVVIPVKNAQETLKETLDSIQRQTMQAFEVIVVDDGSIDTTPILLKDYQQKDPRISAFQTNGRGPAEARNRGMRECKGKYLYFMDADDTISPYALEKMVAIAEKQCAQIAIFGFFRTDGTKAQEFFYPDTQIFRKASLSQILPSLYQSHVLNPVWNKLWDREFLKGIHAQFPDVWYGEDRLFVFSCLRAAQRMVVSQESFYEYHVQPRGSLVDRYIPGKYLICHRIDQKIRALILENGEISPKDDAILFQMFLKSILSCLSVACSSTSPLSFQDKYQEIKRILNSKELKEQLRTKKADHFLFRLVHGILKSRLVLPNLWICLLYTSTKGLEGTPNEVKLKYLADNDFANLSGEELKNAIREYIQEKDRKADDLTGNMVSQGTTPRRLTDLIGSLADLTSGSGDKGTPIILIQGYFDNYTK